MRNARLLALALMGSALLTSPAVLGPARADGVLRIAMTATDIPTTTGMPNNGFEVCASSATRSSRDWCCGISAGPTGWQGLKAGLAESYEQAPDDKKTWDLKLRHGVKFHDGTDFNGRRGIWNLDRYFKNDSPQYEPPAAGMTRARVPVMSSYRKVDDLHRRGSTTKEPAFVFPLYGGLHPVHGTVVVREGRPRLEQGSRCAAGAPARSSFRALVPREVAELSRWDGYWGSGAQGQARHHPAHSDPGGHRADGGTAFGQVDWIEVPPPDGIPFAQGRGFTIVTNSYPHVWPWMFNMAAPNSPLKDVRVRQG